MILAHFTLTTSIITVVVNSILFFFLNQNDIILFYFILFFYCYSITVVCLFSPSLHPPPWFCPCVLYSTSCNPLYPLSPPPPPTPALAIVRLFLTSMSLVIFCLLFSSIAYVPVKGEIIWYLSLTSWLISLSITLFFITLHLLSIL